MKFNNHYLQILTTFLFSLITSFAFTQPDTCTLTLKGIITDDHDGTALPYANVYLTGKKVGASTNLDGYFEIKGLCSGDYELIYSHIGCATQRLKFRLEKDTTLDLHLEHHAELLESITVKASEIAIPRTQIGDNIRGAALEQLRGRSLAESLSSITGVNTLQTGPSIAKPIIQGLHSSRVVMLNNGIQQQGQEWGTDHAPEIDPFVADEMEVIKGAGAVRYGTGALGGVVLVRAKDLPTEKHLEGAVNIVGMSNGRVGVVAGKVGGAFKNIEGLAWRAQGSLKRGGDFHTPRYQLTNTAMQERNFSLQTGYQKGQWKFGTFYSFFNSDLGILRAAHIGNLTDLQTAIGSETPLIVKPFAYTINNPKQAVKHHLLKTEATYDLVNGGQVNLTYSYQLNNRKEFDLRRGGRSDIPSLNLNLHTHSLQTDWEHRPIRTYLNGNWGLQTSVQQNRNVVGTGVGPLIPFYNRTSLGGYGIEKWTMEHWGLEVGARYDFQQLEVKRFNAINQLEISDLNFHNWSVSIGSWWELMEGWRLKTNFGLSERPPNISELFSAGLHHAVAAIEEGDMNLNTEQATKAVLSLAYKKGEILQLEIESYYQKIRDFIYLRPNAENRLTIRGAFPVFKYTQTDAQLLGLDIATQIRVLPKLYVQAKASILEGKDIGGHEEEEYLYQMPANQVEGAIFYTFTTNQEVKDFKILLGAKHVFEQKLAPSGFDFLPPPSAYTLVRAELGGNISIHEQNLGIYLTVNNLFNVSYRNYLNRLRYFADEIGRNVELRLQYKF